MEGLAVTAHEFMALTREELRAMFPQGRCVACSRPVGEDEFGEAGRMTDVGLLCTDCWFEKLGEEVERHPIGRKGLR